MTPDLFPGLVALVHMLLSASAFEPARRAAAALSEIPRDSLAPMDQVRYDVSLALVTLTTTATQPSTHAAIIQRALDTADRALAVGDLHVATEFTHSSLRLLFHRELHADGHHSPLVDEPEAFLSAWHSSDVGELLQLSAAPRRQDVSRISHRDSDRRKNDLPQRPRVLVLPGSYPNFCSPVIESLGRVCTTRVIDLSQRPMLGGNGPNRDMLELRMRHAIDPTFVPSAEIASEMAVSDAVFVDWADRGALLATMSVPARVPLILRIHSMDALSPWIHLVDWSRVDDLIFVSEHLKTVVKRLLKDRLSQTRLHVIPNIIEPSRTAVTMADGNNRRILMIGWGQRVKDPLWALEVLAMLRSEDPRWEIVLVGRRFDPHQSVSMRDYAQAFDERLSREDIRGSVEIVDFTPDLRAQLNTCGFVISSSRRESFAVGLLEAAASGLV
ncbi:MAG: glycosyltransferase, partial [Ornithinimicrobium sp.]